MLSSLISSSHHYYVSFFETSSLKKIEEVMRLFGHERKSQEIFSSVKKSDSIFHLQYGLPFAYGSESLLTTTKSRSKTATIFWYDFYVGMANYEKKIFFICFPYSKLSKVLTTRFRELNITPVFYKSNVGKVLDHMKERDKRESSLEKNGFLLDITKYTAQVKEETNTNKVSLIGANPLNSKIFDVLNENDSISIEATALRLKCTKYDLGDFELSFDRLGNFRFWLKRDSQNTTLPIIKYVFEYFKEIESLDKSNYLSSQSLLEDE